MKTYIPAVLVSLLLLSSNTFSQITIPENAELNVYGNDWKCSRGYKRSGQRCVLVGIPQNAELNVYGNDWKCSRGYKRSGQRCVLVGIPQNAELNVYGNDWKCSRGYKRSGQRCVLVGIPQNAELNVYGNDWKCSRGYKRIGNQCHQMTVGEAEEQRIQMQILAARAREASRKFSVDGEQFTLSEIASKCEVWRWSDNWGDVECSGSKYQVIARKCEAYFTGRYEKIGELECNGNELSPVENYCTTTMYSDSYSDIDC